jgi:hypothetical protein
MQIEITNAIRQIEESKKLWNQASPALTPQENIQGSGLNTSDISNYFEEILSLLNALNEAEKIDLIGWAALKNNFVSNPEVMLQFFQGNPNNPSQILANIPNICSWLWSLKTSIIQLLPIHADIAQSSSDFERTLSGKIIAIENSINQAETYKESIQEIKTDSGKLFEEIQSRLSAATEISNTATSALSVIQSHERESSNAQTNAVAAAANATSEYTNVKELAQSISTSVSQKDALFQEFEDRRAEIASLLENANKVGLAKAFQLRHIALAWTWKAWAVLFIAGIISLVYIGFKEFLPLLSVNDFQSEEITVKVAVRLLLVGPIVWFTWFAARQYSHAFRVGEDYAFKEAAAMAFAGYRNEVKADPEMLKLLQESAIRSFSSNPAKILLKKADHSSPVSEALDKALEKIKPGELITGIAELLKRQG